MNPKTRRDLVVFCQLLALGVLGRWAQPAWNFTPLAAVAAIGGFYFRSALPATLLPLAMLAISDILLESHDSLPVQIAVYAMTLLPIYLGRRARQSDGWRRAAIWGTCAVAPATAFFIVTNFVVWATGSAYAPSLAGLADCYTRALPFYGPMLAGDVCYVGLAAACLAAAHVLDRRAARRQI